MMLAQKQIVWTMEENKVQKLTTYVDKHLIYGLFYNSALDSLQSNEEKKEFSVTWAWSDGLFT